MSRAAMQAAVDLNELQRLAEEAADEAEGDWFDPLLIESYKPILSTRKARRFIAAMSPDTAKKLVAVALAAQMLYDDTMDYIRINKLGGENNHSIAALRTALEELKGKT